MLAIPRLRRRTSYTGRTSPRADRALGRIRLANPDRLRFRPHLARGEVGKVACQSPISATCGPAQGIPLGEMNTSMTINATAAWLLALYIALAEEQGAARLGSPAQCRTTSEGISLARDLRVPARAVAPADQGHDRLHSREMPKWNPTNICSYHLQEAGATPVQELAFALATAEAVLDEVKKSGEVSEEFPRCSAASRSSSMPACASSPRSARCALSSICGTRSARSVTA